MFRSLRTRLTFSYVAFVMILFAVIAAIFTREALQVYARGQNETIAETADQVKQIAATQRPHTFDAIAAEVHRSAEKPAIRILGIEQPLHGTRLNRSGFRFPRGTRGAYIKLP